MALFLGIKKNHPRLKIKLIEKESQLGGNHTWCFHDSDLPPRVKQWLQGYFSKTWNSYEVRFPSLQRNFKSPYHALRSFEMQSRLLSEFPEDILTNTAMKSWRCLSPENPSLLGYEIKTEAEKLLRSHGLIDCRGWINQYPSEKVAFQKFVGLDLKLKKPHGLTSVILKDAACPQIDGYRFFYTLPWSETEILIEDTYYSNHSILKEDRIEQEILKYAQTQGFEVESILRREKGCLPLFLYPQEHIGELPELGAKSNTFNPVTGYTSPQTFQMIDQILSLSALDPASIQRCLVQQQKAFEPQAKFLRFLNRMLFNACRPDKRFKILQKFYTLPEPSIQRFYSGQINFLDKVRLLSGKPPVPVFKALMELTDKFASNNSKKSVPDLNL